MSDHFIEIDDYPTVASQLDGADGSDRACADAEVLQSGLHILNYAFSTEALYEGILSVLTKIVPFSDAGILMPTEDGGLETVVNHAGKLDLRLAALEGVFAEALKGEAILASDVSQLAGWKKASANSAVTFLSGLIMPLASVEKPAIIVCAHVDQAFSDSHLRALKTFAPLAAHAVQWAKQRQEMEQHRDHLEELVEDRTQELAQQKERLAQALDKELELNGLQRQFVSMVCHEFRTPLAIIDGNAQRVQRRHDEITSDGLQKSLGKIRNGVERLTDLIESVLDAAKLEAGRLKFDPQPCSLGNLIEEVCGNYRELNPNYQIDADIDGLPSQALVDPKLMRQVISNLVSNAVKYSPEGTHVWVNGSATDDGRILISVRDDGVGILNTELEKLFDRFYRASTSTGIVGTGIGLHLVKTVVDLHDGWIDVDSKVGEGTAFTVSFPQPGDAQLAQESRETIDPPA